MKRTQQRVFITGLGAITSTGAHVEAIWESLLKGEQGLREVSLWNLSSWPCRLGGEIQGYNPASMLPDRKLIKVISRPDVLGIAAGVQAMAHSQLPAYCAQLSEAEKIQFADSSAIFVGSPGNKFFQQYDFLPLIAKTQGQMPAFAEHLFSEVHPMWLLRILPNNVLAYLGITYGFKGINHNVTNHAVSGMQALIEAHRAIASGQASRAIVVGYDVGTDPQAMHYYDQLGLLSQHDLRPFDKQHDGTVLAEGGCALILESEAALQARSGTALAEVLGGATATESMGLFAIDHNGIPLQQVLNQALNHAQVATDEVGMVIAHGNGSHQSDVTEAKAIAQVFQANAVPVTAFKWSMGHTLCASGVLDAVLGVQAMRARCIPGIANLKQVAAACDSINISAEARSMAEDKRCTVVINRGFAGMNACMVLRGC